MAPPKKVVTPELIAEVRAKVLALYDENKGAYEDKHIERVKTEDLFISRYLTREDCDPWQAAETLSGALRWSKRQGIAEIQESEFSPDLLSLLQYQGKDKNGNRTVYIRYKTAKKIAKRNSKEGDKLKRFAMYYFHKIDTETKGKSTIVLDCRSVAIRDLVKYANKDLAAVAGFLVMNVIRYSPDQVGQLILYEIPRLFSTIAERILKLVPDEHQGKIKIMRKKDIEKVISKDEMPDYLGGKLVASARGTADDEEDSGDEGEVNNLDDIEKTLAAAEEENSKL